MLVVGLDFWFFHFLWFVWFCGFGFVCCVCFFFYVTHWSYMLWVFGSEKHSNGPCLVKSLGGIRVLFLVLCALFALCDQHDPYSSVLLVGGRLLLFVATVSHGFLVM